MVLSLTTGRRSDQILQGEITCQANHTSAACNCSLIPNKLLPLRPGSIISRCSETILITTKIM